MTRRRLSLRASLVAPLLALLAAACPCLAQDQAPQPPRRFELTSLDGRMHQGRITQLYPDIRFETEQGSTVFAWSEILTLQPLADNVPTAGAPTPVAPLRFTLADGSAFFGSIVEAPATEGAFHVALTAGGQCELRPSLLRSIRATSVSTSIEQRLREVLAPDENPAGAAPDDEQDQAVVARGEDIMVLRGRVIAITADAIRFHWNDREVSLPWPRTVGLRLAGAAPRASLCTVHLHTGERFVGRVIAGDDEALTLQSSIFDGLALPWDTVQRVECRSENLVFLSELEPLEYAFTPFFDKQWDYARDRSLAGGPLRLGGRTFARGLTMHSRARLTYRLSERFTQFAATIGIADEMQDRGCVTFRVFGDGRLLWEAQGVRGGHPPHDVLVPIRGVRDLALEVDFDEELDLSDHAVWAFARLVR